VARLSILSGYPGNIERRAAKLLFRIREHEKLNTPIRSRLHWITPKETTSKFNRHTTRRFASGVRTKGVVDSTEIVCFLGQSKRA